MSQRTSASTRIGEHNYQMIMLPPMQSNDLLMDVLGLVGPALGKALDSLVGEKGLGDIKNIMDLDLGSEFFSGAIGDLTKDSTLNKRIFHAVKDAFVTVTHVDGKPLESIFNETFYGNLGEMYQWAFWGMKVQWEKCLSVLDSVKLGQGANQLEKEKVSQFPSPNTSTGSSGG